MRVQVELLNFLEARYFSRANKVTPILARKNAMHHLLSFKSYEAVLVLLYTGTGKSLSAACPGLHVSKKKLIASQGSLASV